MRKQKTNSAFYIIMLLALIAALLAIAVIVKTYKDIDPNPSSPTATNQVNEPTGTPTVTDNIETPTNGSPAPTLTPSPTPSPTPTLLFGLVDMSQLEGISTDTVGDGWSWKYPDRKVNGIGGLYEKNTDKKILYLTFDEGYENGYTPKILDTLKEKDVKVVFFITGQFVRENPDLVKRIYDEGHILGNHTNNHPDMSKQTIEKFINELQYIEEKVEDIIGKPYKMTYYRPPSGRYSYRDINIAKQMGYETVFWRFAYDDYSGNDHPKGEEYCYNKIMENLGDGYVLLLHAVSKENANLLGRIIDDARELGYEFRRLDE